MILRFSSIIFFSSLRLQSILHLKLYKVGKERTKKNCKVIKLKIKMCRKLFVIVNSNLSFMRHQNLMCIFSWFFLLDAVRLLSGKYFWTWKTNILKNKRFSVYAIICVCVDFCFNIFSFLSKILYWFFKQKNGEQVFHFWTSLFLSSF